MSCANGGSDCSNCAAWVRNSARSSSLSIDPPLSFCRLLVIWEGSSHCRTIRGQQGQLCLATRDHKDTKLVNKWLDAALCQWCQGSQGFPQDKDAAQATAFVDVDRVVAQAHPMLRSSATSSSFMRWRASSLWINGSMRSFYGDSMPLLLSVVPIDQNYKGFDKIEDDHCRPRNLLNDGTWAEENERSAVLQRVADGRRIFRSTQREDGTTGVRVTRKTVNVRVSNEAAEKLKSLADKNSKPQWEILSHIR